MPLCSSCGLAAGRPVRLRAPLLPRERAALSRSYPVRPTCIRASGRNGRVRSAVITRLSLRNLVGVASPCRSSRLVACRGSIYDEVFKPSDFDPYSSDEDDEDGVLSLDEIGDLEGVTTPRIGWNSLQDAVDSGAIDEDLRQQVLDHMNIMHDDLTRYRNGEVDELSDELKVLMHGDPDDNPNGPVKTEYHDILEVPDVIENDKDCWPFVEEEILDENPLPWIVSADAGLYEAMREEDPEYGEGVIDIFAENSIFAPVVKEKEINQCFSEILQNEFLEEDEYEKKLKEEAKEHKEKKEEMSMQPGASIHGDPYLDPYDELSYEDDDTWTREYQGDTYWTYHPRNTKQADIIQKEYNVGLRILWDAKTHKPIKMIAENHEAREKLWNGEQLEDGEYLEMTYQNPQFIEELMREEKDDGEDKVEMEEYVYSSDESPPLPIGMSDKVPYPTADLERMELSKSISPNGGVIMNSIHPDENPILGMMDGEYDVKARAKQFHEYMRMKNGGGTVAYNMMAAGYETVPEAPDEDDDDEDEFADAIDLDD